MSDAMAGYPERETRDKAWALITCYWYDWRHEAAPGVHNGLGVPVTSQPASVRDKWHEYWGMWIMSRLLYFIFILVLRSDGQKNRFHLAEAIFWSVFQFSVSQILWRPEHQEESISRGQRTSDIDNNNYSTLWTLSTQQAESGPGDRFISRTNRKLIPASATKRSEDPEAECWVRIGDKNQSRHQQHNGKQWVTQTQTNAGPQTLLTKKESEGNTYIYYICKSFLKKY